MGLLRSYSAWYTARKHSHALFHRSSHTSTIGGAPAAKADQGRMHFQRPPRNTKNAREQVPQALLLARPRAAPVCRCAAARNRTACGDASDGSCTHGRVESPLMRRPLTVAGQLPVSAAIDRRFEGDALMHCSAASSPWALGQPWGSPEFARARLSSGLRPA